MPGTEWMLGHALTEDRDYCSWWFLASVTEEGREWTERERQFLELEAVGASGLSETGWRGRSALLEVQGISRGAKGGGEGTEWWREELSNWCIVNAAWWSGSRPLCDWLA